MSAVRQLSELRVSLFIMLVSAILQKQHIQHIHTEETVIITDPKICYTYLIAVSA